MLSSIRFTFQSEPEAEIPDEELVEAPSILGLTLGPLVKNLPQRPDTGRNGIPAEQVPHRDRHRPVPDGGDLVPPESPIDIVVSNNNVVGVPMVTGTPLEDAKTVIEKAGLSVGKIVSRENPAPAGTVIEQDPDPEMQLPEKSSVDLMIAAEPKIKVPDLKGLSLEDATRVLKRKTSISGSAPQDLSGTAKQRARPAPCPGRSGTGRHGCRADAEPAT